MVGEILDINLLRKLKAYEKRTDRLRMCKAFERDALQHMRAETNC